MGVEKSLTASVAESSEPLLMAIRPFRRQYVIRQVEISDLKKLQLSVMEALNEGYVTEEQVGEMNSTDIINIEIEGLGKKVENRIIQVKPRKGRYRVMRADLALALRDPLFHLSKSRIAEIKKYYHSLRDEECSSVPILYILFLSIRERNEVHVVTRQVLKVIQCQSSSDFTVDFDGRECQLHLENEVFQYAKSFDFVLYLPSNIKLFDSDGKYIL